MSPLSLGSKMRYSKEKEFPEDNTEKEGQTTSEMNNKVVSSSFNVHGSSYQQVAMSGQNFKASSPKQPNKTPLRLSGGRPMLLD